MPNLFRSRKCLGRRREQWERATEGVFWGPLHSEEKRTFQRGEGNGEGREGLCPPHTESSRKTSPWKHHHAGRWLQRFGKVTWSGRGRPRRWTLWGHSGLWSNWDCSRELVTQIWLHGLLSSLQGSRLTALDPATSLPKQEPTSGSFAREACWALTMLAKTRSWIWPAAHFSCRWQEEQQTSWVRGIVREPASQTVWSLRARPFPLTWGYVLGTPFSICSDTNLGRERVTIDTMWLILTGFGSFVVFFLLFFFLKMVNRMSTLMSKIMFFFFTFTSLLVPDHDSASQRSPNKQTNKNL